jgi:hypothetical protein
VSAQPGSNGYTLLSVLRFCRPLANPIHPWAHIILKNTYKTKKVRLFFKESDFFVY